MKRGEVWLVNLDPTIGSEIQKTRPAVIVSSDALRKLPMRIVVPITGWKPKFEHSPWAVPIEADGPEGLTKKSAADATQVRAVSTKRLVQRIGHLPEPALSAVAAAVAICLEFR
jgi:mRNA interferase MazF